MYIIAGWPGGPGVLVSWWAWWPPLVSALARKSKGPANARRSLSLQGGTFSLQQNVKLTRFKAFNRTEF